MVEATAIDIIPFQKKKIVTDSYPILGHFAVSPDLPRSKQALPLGGEVYLTLVAM
jgi:hypothetical protein